ncbi:(S)-benzoin forming benzil reductase [Paenibacillus sp. GCM10012307]|uniref:(S)-benzoin forming benzil reductase n=1 Tax=Paenibacillus roseus TaxID=2798579 RepID=A0A934IVJ9_9BACL|nr:(S)-benzoin forming benzil reductase [Paenibacillus roseus]MBJ6360091.1 (S)-benzoin forming benzil reductase [Paenibacillus roseus]
MNVFIITGTSRGIGEALAAQLMGDDSHHVCCISRAVNENLINLARDNNKRLSYHSFDLNHITAIDDLFAELMGTIQQLPGINAICLINNAGMLSPIAPIEQINAADIVENVTVNLLAPMAMTSSFIRHTLALPVDKRIMNISSASAKYLLPSQSCYSTSKAALDSFTKSVCLEQMNNPNPVKVVSVYPGMVDTQMQTEIRSISRETFSFVDQFIQIAEQDHLQTPAYTAGKLIDILLSPDYGHTAVIEEL